MRRCRPRPSSSWRSVSAGMLRPAGLPGTTGDVGSSATAALAAARSAIDELPDSVKGLRETVHDQLIQLRQRFDELVAPGSRREDATAAVRAAADRLHAQTARGLAARAIERGVDAVLDRWNACFRPLPPWRGRPTSRTSPRRSRPGSVSRRATARCGGARRRRRRFQCRPATARHSERRGRGSNTSPPSSPKRTGPAASPRRCAGPSHSRIYAGPSSTSNRSASSLVSSPRRLVERHRRPCRQAADTVALSGVTQLPALRASVAAPGFLIGMAVISSALADPSVAAHVTREAAAISDRGRAGLVDGTSGPAAHRAQRTRGCSGVRSTSMAYRCMRTR